MTPDCKKRNVQSSRKASHPKPISISNVQVDMGILENQTIGNMPISVFKKNHGNCKPISASRHLTSEDKQRLKAIGLCFKVEVIIPNLNPEGNCFGIEIYNYLKSKRFDLELNGYQIGMSPQNHRFDIIPQGESLVHVYVPVHE